MLRTAAALFALSLIHAPLAGQADPADPLALAVAMLASSRRVAGEGG